MPPLISSHRLVAMRPLQLQVHRQLAGYLNSGFLGLRFAATRFSRSFGKRHPWLRLAKKSSPDYNWAGVATSLIACPDSRKWLNAAVDD